MLLFEAVNARVKSEKAHQDFILSDLTRIFLCLFVLLNVAHYMVCQSNKITLKHKLSRLNLSSYLNYVTIHNYIAIRFTMNGLKMLFN